MLSRLNFKRTPESLLKYKRWSIVANVCMGMQDSIALNTAIDSVYCLGPFSKNNHVLPFSIGSLYMSGYCNGLKDSELEEVFETEEELSSYSKTKFVSSIFGIVPGCILYLTAGVETSLVLYPVLGCIRYYANKKAIGN